MNFLIFYKKEIRNSFCNRWSFVSFVLLRFYRARSHSYKSWSVPIRTKLAKLSHSLNRLSQKESLISLFTY